MTYTHRSVANTPDQGDVKQVLFDLGNVLFCIDESKAYTRVKSLIDPGKCSSGWSNNYFIPHLEKYSNGEISTVLFINGIIAYAYRQVTALDVIEAWNSMLLQLHPDTLSFLQAAHRQYRLYLYSNINDLHYKKFAHLLRPHCTLEQFEGFFEKCYYSHLIGRSKPAVESFEYLLEDAGITAEKTLFFDDRPENVQGARRAGIQAHHLEYPCDFNAMSAVLASAR